jgi:predicted alpha/beta hydrolase
VPKRLFWVAFLGLVSVVLVRIYAIGSTLSRSAPATIGPPPIELGAETVTFPSESGSVIHGWFSLSQTRRGAVLLLPGARANRLAMVGRARFLRDSGYSVLLIDFQATGESPGAAITFGWRERFDVLAAVQFLNRRLPGEPIGIIGTSLGGAAALLATPPLEVQALIIEAVYPSIERAVVNRLRMRLGRFGPLAASILLIQLRLRLGVAAAELKPVDHVSALRCPVLIIGGTDDQHTTAAAILSFCL